MDIGVDIDAIPSCEDNLAEDIRAVIGELAGSETRMNAYSAMFQQKATCDYQELFHTSKVAALLRWNALKVKKLE